MTNTVWVVGAPRSGVTSLAGALRGRLPGHVVVEAGEPATGATTTSATTTAAPPTIVIAACSAVAPLTASDCAAIDVHAHAADVMIGVLTKVDAHRGWRAVLAANHAALAAHAPRYRDVTWVGVAAAPDVGEPNLDDLLLAVCDPSPRLLPKALRHHGSRGNRPLPRDELQRHRLELGRGHRQRCTALRTDFRDRATDASRADAADFGAAFTRAASQVLVELRDRIDASLRDPASLGDSPSSAAPAPTPFYVAPELPPPPRGGGAAESRLTLALGAGFGLGAAATVGRTVTAMAPGLAIAAVAVAILAGCVLTAWLVSTRALLHRRATLDRWVTEAAAAVRLQGEDMIAEALLDAQADRGRRTGP